MSAIKKQIAQMSAKAEICGSLCDFSSDFSAHPE